MKVSDEFTVPLCAIHHHHIHTTGKEREWWQERNIYPLEIANALWQQSRQRDPSLSKAKASEDNASDQAAEPSHQESPVNDASSPAVGDSSSNAVRRG